MPIFQDLALQANLLSTPDRANFDQVVQNLSNTPALSQNFAANNPNSASNNLSNYLAPSTPSVSATAAGTQSDFRIRVGYLPGQSNPYPGILAPLTETQGLMFPYTPSIAVTQDVDYVAMTMTHSNQDYYSYSRTPNVTINLSGKFTVQNRREGLYALACLHFLRSVSKMYFGQSDAGGVGGKAGIPPPVLQLSGYGTYMFNKVRVIVKSHNYTFDENMNTVAIQASGGTVRLPALFSVSLSLTVQNTARAQRQDFNLDQFRSGALMASAPNNSGWI